MEQRRHVLDAGPLCSDAREIAAMRREQEGAHFIDELSALIKHAEAEALPDYLHAAHERTTVGGALMHESHPIHTAAKVRDVCVEMIFDICTRFRVSSETSCACVVVVDRFLSEACQLQTSHPAFVNVAWLARNPQLMVLACFLIVCKFREHSCPLMEDLVVVSCDMCSVEEIRSAELTILEIIDWNIDAVSAIDICNKIIIAAPVVIQRRLAHHLPFVIEAAYFSSSMLAFSTTSIAVTAIILAAERLHIPSKYISFIPCWIRVDASAITAMRVVLAAVTGGAMDMTSPPADDMRTAPWVITDATDDAMAASTVASDINMSPPRGHVQGSAQSETEACLPRGIEDDLLQGLLGVSPTNVVYDAFCNDQVMFVDCTEDMEYDERVMQ